MSYLLFYDCINLFKDKFYKNLLTTNHLLDGETLFKSLHDAEGIEIKGLTIPGFPLSKDGVKYILPSKVADGEGGYREVNLQEDLPIVVQRKSKVFSSGVGYLHIKKFQSAKFKPEKHLTFRELFDTFSNSLNHSNKEHYKILWFFAMASMISRINFRLSTPPGFGKDSVVDIMGNLIGNASTIENPTVAKLEYLSFSKWLAVNEVVDITKAEWRNIEQYLLSAGAMKPKINKRSRSRGIVGEVLDISKLSLSLFYNDIDQYPDSDKYFDKVTKKAVKDRFVPIRLFGTYKEDFNKINTVNINTFVDNNMKKYEDIIRSFIYYKHNILSEQHYYKRKVSNLPERHKTSIGKVLNLIDAYCITQEEYTFWENKLYSAIEDYYNMLEYPLLIKQAINKKGEQETNKFLQDTLSKAGTFSDKKKLINEFIVGKLDKVKEHTFW